MSEKTKYELDTEARLGAEKMPEPSIEAIDRAAHILSEWLDDAAPLHERRYRDPARSVLKFAAYLSTVSPLSDGGGWSDDMSTAPKDGTRLLLWACSHHVFTGAYETSDEPDDELDGWWDDGGGWWEPHHWRSLPAPPRDEVK